MLKMENVALLIVDIQGNLARLMHGKELLFKNVQKLIKGIQVFRNSYSLGGAESARPGTDNS